MDCDKVSALKNIFAFNAMDSDGGYTLDSIMKRFKQNLITLSQHQNWFSRNVGFSLPKSLTIATVELAVFLDIPLNEQNLAKLLYLIISYCKVNEFNEFNEFTAKINNLKAGNLIISGKSILQGFNENSAINHVLKVIEFILSFEGSAMTEHFNAVILERQINEQKPKYKNSFYSAYNNYNLTSLAILGADSKDFKLTRQSLFNHLALPSESQPFTSEDLKDSIEGCLLNVWSCLYKGSESEDKTNACNEFLYLYYYNCCKALLPPNTINRQEIISFYQSVDRSFSFICCGISFKIKVDLVSDDINGHKYLVWQVGRNEAFIKNKLGRHYIFHFKGNYEHVRSTLNLAGKFAASTDAIQVITGYPCRDVNRVLNNLTPAKTSVKGSANSAIAAYNFLLDKGFINSKSKIGLYAFSYGNFAAANFINSLKKVSPNLKLYFIGVGTGTDLDSVARKCIIRRNYPLLLYQIAHKFELIDQSSSSNILNTLKKFTVPSLIISAKDDPIIEQAEQLTKNKTEGLEYFNFLEIDEIICPDDYKFVSGMKKFWGFNEVKTESLKQFIEFFNKIKELADVVGSDTLSLKNNEMKQFREVVNNGVTKKQIPEECKDWSFEEIYQKVEQMNSHIESTTKLFQHTQPFGQQIRLNKSEQLVEFDELWKVSLNELQSKVNL